MKVAVCARHIGMHAGTGADQVVVRGFRALARLDTHNQYAPYHEVVGRWGRGGGLRADLAAIVSDVFLKNVTVPVWARARGIDVFLHLAPPCIYTEFRIPQVCYIYDVPREEEGATSRHRLFNALFVEKSARKADHILALSQTMREEIVSSYGVPADRVSVVYPCVDFSEFRPRATDDAVTTCLAKHRLERGFVMGLISRVVARKNPRAYFEVFARLPVEVRRKHPLVICGPRSLDAFRGAVPDELLRKVDPDVRLLGRVESADIPLLYNSAGVVLFPSRYEGLGLPVVEAMACQARFVATNIPAIREICGSDLKLFDPDDWDGMAGACQARMGSTSGGIAFDAAKRDLLQRFSPESFVRGISDVLRQVTSR